MVRVRVTLACIVAMLLLSACEMTVRIDTTLDGRGGGTFAVEIALDAEAATALRQTGNIDSVRGLFDGLRAKGWDVAISEGRTTGSSFRASRDFEDARGLDRALDELRTASGSQTQQAPSSFRISFDYDASRNFLSSRTRFSGTFDTSLDDTATEETRALVQQVNRVLRFEVRATLPGSVDITAGDGDLEGRTVVWRPVLGERRTFGARSSALRVGPLLAILLPSLALLAFATWWWVGRRRPDDAPLAIMPETPDDERPDEA